MLVTIRKPSKPTALSTWHDSTKVATVIPNGEMPEALNSIPFQEWSSAPQNTDAWAYVEGQANIAEPAFVLPCGKRAAAGVVIQEPDGRIWLVSPTNGFGGYSTTFPKGRVEGSVGLQASAIREAYEETGLQVSISGFLADSMRSLTYTRYYLARRVGGNPAAMGWETQAVHLAPLGCLNKLLTHTNDAPLLPVILAL